MIKIGVKNYLLIYGYGTDEDGNGYNFRKNYDHKPTKTELKEDITQLIDGITDSKILQGFRWNEVSVYLSTENQMNFKAAFDLNMQTGGLMLPVKFKLGEDTEGNAVYHTFENMEDFTNFYTSAVSYINQCLNEGWAEKDSLDMSSYE
ncbi:MAG: hypothetical protein PUE86_09090 [Prevotella sp.]|nr:hypothetical protein [Prevotella sp.]